jgi:electron transport complex protein RnfG
MTEQDRPAAPRPTVVQNGLILAAVAAICTTLVALTFNVTKARIAANEQAYLEQSLAPVLAGIVFDNDIIASAFNLPPPHVLPGNETAVIYPLLAGSQPAGALFVVTAEDGFAGPIKLLIGVDFEGVVTGVRALEHKETPGIGDGIDTRVSNWIDVFSGTSLESPDREMWAIKRDDGAFDQLTGASVTSRAVVNAVDLTLRYFEVNRGQVFATKAVTGVEND